MIDLVNLASEITQGRWRISTVPDRIRGCSLLIVESADSNFRVACVSDGWSDDNPQVDANATAMALVPELIAEAIDMGEKFEIQRKMINDLTLENVRLRGVVRAAKGAFHALDGEISILETCPDQFDIPTNHLRKYIDAAKRITEQYKT